MKHFTHRFLSLLIALIFSLTQSGISYALGSNPGHMNFATPTYGAPPDYPNSLGVPAAGVYKPPADGRMPKTWYAFPSYPSNFYNWRYADRANCTTESINSWYLCAYSMGWKVSVRPAGATYTAFMLDRYTDGYMRLTGTNGTVTLQYENPTYMVISDGTHVMMIRQNYNWSTNWIGYEYGFLH